MKALKTTMSGIDFYGVNNDINGNPRFVFHFLDIPLQEDERNLNFKEQYILRCEKAKKIGAYKYRGKWFGGGLVVQSYNLENTAKEIKNL